MKFVFCADFSLCFRVADESNKLLSIDIFFYFLFFYIYVVYFNILSGVFIFALIVTMCVSFVMSAPLSFGTDTGSHRDDFFIESFPYLNRGQSCCEMPHWVVISGFI